MQIDMNKVKVDTLKEWIHQRVQEMLKFEDEVVVEYICNCLTDSQVRTLI